MTIFHIIKRSDQIKTFSHIQLQRNIAEGHTLHTTKIEENFSISILNFFSIDIALHFAK